MSELKFPMLLPKEERTTGYAPGDHVFVHSPENPGFVLGEDSGHLWLLLTRTNAFYGVLKVPRNLAEVSAAQPPAPCLHVRLNVNVCEDCGAEFDFV
jgi:hypothetical protein